MDHAERGTKSNNEVNNEADIFHSDGKNQVEIDQDGQQNYCHESSSQDDRHILKQLDDTNIGKFFAVFYAKPKTYYQENY